MIDPTGHEVHWNPGDPPEPDPNDPAEQYALWCELNPCPTCGGSEETCGTCDGSGIDPDAEYDGPPPI